ncbi:MAG: hypothetical protein NZ108_03590 [Bacteroidia bacterium]|nr:hypothetical protein [Bacteroidia bacterium]
MAIWKITYTKKKTNVAEPQIYTATTIMYSEVKPSKSAAKAHCEDRENFEFKISIMRIEKSS